MDDEAERYRRVTVLVPISLAEKIKGSKSDLVRRALARELGEEIPAVRRGRPKVGKS